MKKIFITLFAAAMMALSLGSVSAFADTGSGEIVDPTQDTVVIDSVSINPSCGAFPSVGSKLTFDGVDIPAGLVMDTGNSYFYMRPDREKAGLQFYTDGRCNPGTVYGINVALYVMDGYRISDSANFYISGLKVTNVRKVSVGDRTLYILARDFERTSGISSVISYGLITELKTPVVGKTIADLYGTMKGDQEIDINIASHIDDFTGYGVMSFHQFYVHKYNDAKGTWENMTSKEVFQTDGRYKIVGVIGAGKWSDGTESSIDYELGSSFTITVNGQDYEFPTSYGKDGKNKAFDFEYEFDPITTINSVSATITEPAVGAHPSTKVSVPADARYTASASWCAENTRKPVTADSTFGNDYYTVYITFYAKDGYSFINAFDMFKNCTINGKTGVRRAHDPDYKWITFEANFLCGEHPSWMIDEIAIAGVSIPKPGGKVRYGDIDFRNPTTTGEKASIDSDNTYYAYWNTSTKSWFMMKEGEEFKEGVLYKVQVSIRANEGYRLNPEATGSFQTTRISDPTPADSKVVFSDLNTPSMERLLLSLVISGTDCKSSLAGHKYTDRWYTDDHPSNTCLNGGCGHIFGDVNESGTVNIVDAQLAYDLATKNSSLTERKDYHDLYSRADVSGGPDFRTGDGKVDAVDAWNIQRAAINGM